MTNKDIIQYLEDESEDLDRICERRDYTRREFFEIIGEAQDISYVRVNTEECIEFDLVTPPNVVSRENIRRLENEYGWNYHVDGRVVTFFPVGLGYEEARGRLGKSESITDVEAYEIVMKRK